MGALLALVGPTAAGKSALALALARERDAEIVAVDAFTVYRGMDVGTAKPSSTDRALVPHHLVDVLGPAEDCAVRWFQAQARAAIAGVHARGRTALLVGGSGLYFRATVDDLAFPPTDAPTRARIAARAERDPPAAHRELTAADPVAAAKIDPGNVRRTVRALEVIALTGRPFSAFALAWDEYRSIYPGLVVVGLDVPRATVMVRIDARVDAMVAGGLVEECRRLAGQRLSRTARQAIGYAEVLDHLAGCCTLVEAVERIKLRTRRYAARQARWFRADPRVRWCDRATALEELAAGS